MSFRGSLRGLLPLLCAIGLLPPGWTGLRAEPEPGPASAPLNVVVLGDSLASGYGVDLEAAFPALLQEKIHGRQWPFRVINAAVSGDTSAGGLSRVNWVLRQPVAVLVLELGGNDGLRGIPTEETERNLQGIIDRAKARYPEVRILLAGMRMPANMGEDYTRRFAALFPRVAQRNQTALVPFLLEGVAGMPELNQPDLIHPTAAGQKILAANVWKALEPLLQELLEAQPTE